MATYKHTEITSPRYGSFCSHSLSMWKGHHLRNYIIDFNSLLHLKFSFKSRIRMIQTSVLLGSRWDGMRGLSLALRAHWTTAPAPSPAGATILQSELITGKRNKSTATQLWWTTVHYNINHCVLIRVIQTNTYLGHWWCLSVSGT